MTAIYGSQSLITPQRPTSARKRVLPSNDLGPTCTTTPFQPVSILPAATLGATIWVRFLSIWGSFAVKMGSFLIDFGVFSGQHF
jgi:hypothetical protein